MWQAFALLFLSIPPTWSQKTGKQIPTWDSATKATLDNGLQDSKTSTQGLWLHWYTLYLDSCFAQNLRARVAKSLKARLPGSKQEIGALTDSRKCRTFLSSPTLILYFLIGQIIDSASRKELVCTPKKGEGVSKMKILYIRGGPGCPIKG